MVSTLSRLGLGSALRRRGCRAAGASGGSSGAARAPGRRRRQRPGQRWQLAAAGRAVGGRWSRPSRAGTPVISSRPIDRQPVADGWTSADVGRPSSLGAALQLFPPAPAAPGGPSRSSDLLDRDIGGQRARPTCRSERRRAADRGAASRAPQVAASASIRLLSSSSARSRTASSTDQSWCSAQRRQHRRRRPVASRPTIHWSRSRSGSVSVTVERQASPSEAQDRRLGATGRSHSPGLVDPLGELAASARDGSCIRSAWRRVAGGCCVPCRTP